MDRLKPFLLTTTSLVLFAGLFTPVSSQMIIGQPPSGNVSVLSAPLQVATPTGVPPSVSPQVITTQPTSINTTVLNDPLPVETQTAARIPIQMQGTDTSCISSECSVQFTVPTGKRLVVEYLAALTQILPAGSSGVSASILLLTKFRGQSQTIHVGLTENNGPGPNSYDVLGEVVKLYAAPDTDVICKMVVPNFENIAFFNCSVIGFLEDVT
jgi:hypothetical protein